MIRPCSRGSRIDSVPRRASAVDGEANAAPARAPSARWRASSRQPCRRRSGLAPPPGPRSTRTTRAGCDPTPQTARSTRAPGRVSTSVSRETTAARASSGSAAPRDPGSRANAARRNTPPRAATRGRTASSTTSGNRQYGRCVGCPSGQEKCGTTCCPERREVRRPRHGLLLPGADSLPCAGKGRQDQLLSAERGLLPGQVLPASHTMCDEQGTAHLRSVHAAKDQEVWEHVLHQGTGLLQREVLLEEPEVLRRRSLLPEDG